jgi:hypothetical protein
VLRGGFGLCDVFSLSVSLWYDSIKCNKNPYASIDAEAGATAFRKKELRDF